MARLRQESMALRKLQRREGAVGRPGKGAAEARLLDYDPVEPGAAASTPLFRDFSVSGGGKHFTVAGLRALIRERMRALGCTNARDWGAHSCRIGEATDLVATGKAFFLLLQAKGRWASDIGKIYARMTRRGHLAASELMQSAR